MLSIADSSLYKYIFVKGYAIKFNEYDERLSYILYSYILFISLIEIQFLEKCKFELSHNVSQITLKLQCNIINDLFLRKYKI